MRALVMSGGGSHGAYQVGVLEHLVLELDRDYDYIAGISVGALNAGMLAQSPAGELAEGWKRLAAIWEELEGNRSIWKHWFVPYVPGLLWKDAFYDSSPLKRLVRRHMDEGAIRSSGRELRLGAVSLESGAYHEATQDDDDLASWVIASSAFPAMFLPEEIDGELWTDGGARRMTPLKGAIDAGATEIDVIITRPRGMGHVELDDGPMGLGVTGLKIAQRTLELLTDEIFERDLDLCMAFNHAAEAEDALRHAGVEPPTGGGSGKRHVDLTIHEPSAWPGFDSLSFDPGLMAGFRLLGLQDAQSMTG